MAQWVKSLLQNHEDLTPVTLVLGGVEVETCRSPDAGKPEGSTGELWVQTEEVTRSCPLAFICTGAQVSVLFHTALILACQKITTCPHSRSDLFIFSEMGIFMLLSWS